MSKKSRRVAKARRALLALSLVLVTMVVAVGGTIAWLTDETEVITNTFTATDIEITLDETLQSDGTPLGSDAWTAQIVPGAKLDKDPVVTVNDKVTDVDIYLFVKFEKSVANLDKYLTFTSLLDTTTETEGNEDATWHKLGSASTETTEVWYRVVKTDDAVKSWNLIAGNTVTVNSKVVKPLEDGETLAEDAVAMPANDLTMKYTAYAVQYDGFEDDVAGAWAQAQSASAN